MRLLRTAAGGFINAATIVRLLRNDDNTGWLAVLANGEEILSAPYYSAPGRIEQDLPHLVPDRAAVTPAVAAACLAEGCCGG